MIFIAADYPNLDYENTQGLSRRLNFCKLEDRGKMPIEEIKEMLSPEGLHYLLHVLIGMGTVLEETRG